MERIDAQVEKIYYPTEEADASQRASGTTKVFYIVQMAADWGRFTAKGGMVSRPRVGERFTLTGEWAVWNGSKYFKVSSVDYDIPVSERDLLGYACELTDGFGSATAEAIWQAMGDDWRSVEAGQVRGLTEEKVRKFRETIAYFDLCSKRVEAVAFLMGLGATPNLAEAAFERYQERTVPVVREDIYSLCGVPNYGFRKIDALMREKAGIGESDPRRIGACIRYVVDGIAESGDTLIGWNELYGAVSSNLPCVGQEQIVERLQKAIEEGYLVPFCDAQAVARKRDYEKELRIVEAIA